MRLNAPNVLINFYIKIKRKYIILLILIFLSILKLFRVDYMTEDMVIMVLDGETINNYLEKFYNLIGWIVNVENDFNAYNSDSEIAFVLNRICERENLDFNFVTDGDEVYLKSDNLNKDVLDFPFLLSVFEEEWKEYIKG